jgi:hypothetical protein
MAYFNVLYHHLIRETGENYGQSQSGWLVTQVTFEPGTSQIQMYSTIHYCCVTWSFISMI